MSFFVALRRDGRWLCRSVLLVGNVLTLDRKAESSPHGDGASVRAEEAVWSTTANTTRANSNGTRDRANEGNVGCGRIF